jgi:hypothetical protein
MYGRHCPGLTVEVKHSVIMVESAAIQKCKEKPVISSRIDAIRSWLVAPIGHATDIKRRLVFRALRSRLFFIVALLITIPTFIQAVGATWKAERGNPEVGPALLWTVAIVYWVLFALTFVLEHWRLRRRADRTELARSNRKARENAGKRQHQR